MEELRILVTTDNHLGFAERDPVRGEDSFRAFEEVFTHARETRADCILICGDLFHDVSPSKYTIYRTMEILQRNIMGDHSIEIECTDNGNFVSIDKRRRGVNYSSPNMRIQMPIFAINGNHDEPSGHKGVTALDIFAEAGLVNYFGAIDGKTTNSAVRPIVLKKGQIVFNLYGMGGIRDETMAKLLSEERISLTPANKGVRALVIHQTRCGVGINTYVPEELLSKDLDLVIWGHMHKSEPIPVQNYKMGFYTLQPGSTVQTSLCKAESGDKHCVLLKVKEDGWSSTPILMMSPRSLVFRTISANASNIEEKIRTEMLSILEVHGNSRRPLVRLRVEIDGALPSTVIPKRTMAEFADRVANPKDVLRIIHKKKQALSKKAEEVRDVHPNAQFALDVEDVRILSKDIFAQSIMECIDRENKTVISHRYDEIVQEVVKVLKSHRWTDIEKEIHPAVLEIEKRFSFGRAHVLESISRQKQMREIEDRQSNYSINAPDESVEEIATKMKDSEDLSNILRKPDTSENILQDQRMQECNPGCFIAKQAKNTADVLAADILKEDTTALELDIMDKNTLSAHAPKRPKTDYTFSSFWD
ncbi:double-strand break repair protein MRE11 [Nematocida parisii]|nr:double-strand break repair protein MRE11 [Nematocida parisii]KAI5125769.1 double-strand break repair protein MRE11 [Nematocida parisii]KAI5140198.1 double-strand break repair protein MRE11 [Nematocida parisii]